MKSFFCIGISLVAQIFHSFAFRLEELNVSYTELAALTALFSPYVNSGHDRAWLETKYWFCFCSSVSREHLLSIHQTCAKGCVSKRLQLWSRIDQCSYRFTVSFLAFCRLPDVHIIHRVDVFIHTCILVFHDCTHGLIGHHTDLSALLLGSMVQPYCELDRLGSVLGNITFDSLSYKHPPLFYCTSDKWRKCA